jgi:hypothetical protein
VFVASMVHLQRLAFIADATTPAVYAQTQPAQNPPAPAREVAPVCHLRRRQWGMGWNKGAAHTSHPQSQASAEQAAKKPSP